MDDAVGPVSSTLHVFVPSSNAPALSHFGHRRGASRMESWFMRLLLVAVVIGLALGWPPASSAQTGQPAPTNMAVRVTESARPMRP